MKKLIIISIILISIVSLNGCKDFLDIQPVSQSIAVSNTSADSLLYKTSSEVEAALAGVYSDFRNEYFSLDYFVNGDAQSDDAYAGADNPANFQIDEFSIDATNSNVSRDWAYLYGTIGKANAVYNNVEAVPDLSADRKKQIKGEAAWIRAYMYFQAVQLWGDVPLQLTEVKTVSIELLPEIYPILFPARTAMADVYEQIIKDLELALENVPVTASHKGFVTKGAANALLAKVYAAIQPPQWNKVQQYADAVIAGGYSLVPEYDMLWNNTNENSSEAIFEINYEGTSSSGNWGASMFRGMDWKKFNTPSNDLVAAFDAEGDVIRKNSSISFDDVSGRWSDPYWPQSTFPFINKYRNIAQPSPQNFILLRLADIILLKAEALNANGDVSGAATLVNQIRSRVNLPNTNATDQQAMRLAIEKERRFELAFEGHRWYDLKRTGRAVEVMNNVKGPGGASLGYSVNENRLLWPIPQSELDKNTKLVQNTGY
ncbi:MAG: RagB/SusD family nutrient uptake outer membrane protein [Bacteroidales bacterium]|nr:RagB/SusD family nutrient uptake outer membrane protein [Bacteroidales bacterium]